MKTNTAVYDKYKSSGAEWLGEVPEHWEITRLKYIFKISKRIAGELGYPVLSITQNGIKIKDTESGEGQLSMDYSKYQFVYKGDFAMNHMDLLTGYVDISKYNGVISPDYRVFELVEKQLNKNYLLLLLQLCYNRKVFYAYGQGVSMLGRWRFPAENFNDFLFPIPLLVEQTAIAEFLDRKTVLIDQAIGIKEKQIELLKERRQILIHKAVTRGLNPNVKLKDSGVEWIGEVPEGWEVIPIRRIVDVRDGTHDTPLYVDDGIDVFPLVTSKDFEGDKINFENIKKISKKDHINISKRSGVTKGDVLMSMIGGNIGKSVIIDDNDSFSVKNVALFKTSGNLWLAKFLRFYFESGLLKKQIELKSRGGAQGFLSLGDIRNLIFFKIPIKEIRQIVEYLENTISNKIAAAISLKEKEIEKLQEYKASLINSAVTGKIKVC